MCGIVGYIGGRRADGILINGLKRLEYRGYDSAGIATLDDNGAVTLTRVKGKVAQLENEIARSAPDKNSVGIAHTRWATHGEPSVKNAHPHQANDVILVHNGIIENYKRLRQSITNYEFRSDTDTEVLAALIDSLYTGDTPFITAVAAALRLVEGTYGIAVTSVREPEKIVVARMGSPLIIGVGEHENLVASDASALLGATENAIYLNDGEIAEVTREYVDIKNLDLIKLPARLERLESDITAIQKGGFEHFLMKEIAEQPESLKETLRGRINDDCDVRLGGLNLSPEELRSLRHIVIVGCGTAYYAGLLASYYVEQLVGDVTIEVVIASEFRYRAAHLPEHAVALIVSQSGETADTLACLRVIKSRGIKTIGIVNTIGSTIAREVDGGVYVHAGPEISVASTKAFTSQAAAMVMFGIVLAQVRGSNLLAAEFAGELLMLPNEIAQLIDSKGSEINDIASEYATYDHAIFMGRDTAYPVALEGALKLKEISYIDANAYAAGELKHGPLALVSPEYFEVSLILEGRLFDKAVNNLHEVLARGGRVLVITNSDQEIHAHRVLRVDSPLTHLAPILLNVAQQLFAYHVAVARGNDVDQPRNLAKSVTVE